MLIDVLHGLLVFHMGDLIDFEKAVKERYVRKLEAINKCSFDDVISQLALIERRASEVICEYYQLMLQNPNQVVLRLPEFIEKVREANPQRYYESLAGGPKPEWTGSLLDILGMIYPSLERDERESGLKQCLYFLDSIRSDYAANQVELINDPWLAADIVITRPVYWCGYKEYANFALENKTWKSFSKKMNCTGSYFWLAMAVTHPEYTSLDVRKNFYEQYPILMDRTKDAIAAMVAVYGGRKVAREGLELEVCINERLVKHDSLLHDDIRLKIDEKKWVLLD